MYESFFNLRTRPFDATPNPDCCAALPPMLEAFEELFSSLKNQQGIGILSAPAGLGKTLLCVKLAEQLESSSQIALLLNGRFATRRALLQAILFEWNQPYNRMSEQELRLGLSSVIKQSHDQNQNVVIIVDEAHLLGLPILEEIRTLANLSESGGNHVNILLSGQLSLEETLASPGLEALNQRVISHASMQSFTLSESSDYIEYRIHQAGGDFAVLFTDEAIRTICQASDGVPRCLNQLCDHSLILAATAQQQQVADENVRAALEELKQLPLNWNDPSPVKSPIEQIREQVEATPSTEEPVVEKSDGENLNSTPSQPAQYETENEVTVFEFGSDTPDENSSIEISEEIHSPETVVKETAEVVEFGFEADSNDYETVDAAELAGDCFELEFAEDSTVELQLTPESSEGQHDVLEIDDPGEPQWKSVTTSRPEVEQVVDHYAILESQFLVQQVRDRELVSTAAANSSIEANSDSPVETESFETYVSLSGMERASSADPTVNKEDLKNRLLTPLASTSTSGGFDKGRRVLMMQESIGLNVSGSELNKTGSSSTVVKEWCTQSVTTEDQVCNHLNLVITQERQMSAGSQFHSAGEAETVSLQFVSATDSTRTLDSPSRLSEEPFLKTVSEFEMENRTHASVANTHREIQRLVSHPEVDDPIREDDTNATDFEAVLNSPLWANFGPEFGEELEAYDVIQPETEEPTTNSETTKRWDALFTDLRQQTADT